MHELQNREEICVNIFKKGKTKEAHDSVSPIEGIIPHAKQYLRRKKNEEFGRFVVSKRMVDPGEILIVENAFVSIPLKGFRFKRCWHCTAENNHVSHAL